MSWYVMPSCPGAVAYFRLRMTVETSSFWIGWKSSGICLWRLTKFGGSGVGSVVCDGNRAFRRISHLSWKASFPSSAGSGLLCVAVVRRQCQISDVVVFCSQDTQYCSLANWTACFHSYRWCLACCWRLLLVRFARWHRSACCRFFFFLLRSGCHHGACFGRGLVQGMAALVALLMMVVIAPTACSACSALLMLLRSRPEVRIVCRNRVQSAFRHAHFGTLLGTVRFRWMVHIAWSEVESGLISCIRTFSVMLPAVKQRSMTDGCVLFLGKWVGYPGLLCREKWWLSIQSAMVCDWSRCLRIWSSSNAVVLPHHSWCVLKSPIMIAGRSARNVGRRLASACGVPGE
jgi:hypothetical protein